MMWRIESFYEWPQANSLRMPTHIYMRNQSE